MSVHHAAIIVVFETDEPADETARELAGALALWPNVSSAEVKWTSPGEE